MRTENEIRSALAAHENEETGPNTDALSLAHKTGVAQAFRWVLGDRRRPERSDAKRGRAVTASKKDRLASAQIWADSLTDECDRAAMVLLQLSEELVDARKKLQSIEAEG